MKYLLLLFSLQTLLFSCKQTPDPKKVKQFVTTLHIYTGFKIKQAQQEFVNQMTEDLKKLFVDTNATIHTKQLRELLEKAKEANQLSTKEIEKTIEIDKEINLKQKTLDENNMFRSLYENEFPNIIEIMERKEIAKLRKASKLISEKQDAIEKIQITTKEADAQFANKYKVSFDDDPGN